MVITMVFCGCVYPSDRTVSGVGIVVDAILARSLAVGAEFIQPTRKPCHGAVYLVLRLRLFVPFCLPLFTRDFCEQVALFLLLYVPLVAVSKVFHVGQA